jgi:hypothetical protein
MNIHLVSFGDTALYGGALTRMLVSASQWKTQTGRVFKSINIYNENHLIREHTDFWNQHKAHIENNRRGWGYWIWKSLLVKHVMSRVPENDVVLWIDAGCQLNTSAVTRFCEYYDLAVDHGICCFDVRMPEYQWTKADTAVRIIENDPVHMNTGQIVTTAVFLLNDEFNRNIVQQWFEMGIENSHHYINDQPSAEPNWQGFVEHRHDQSILSLLIKKHGRYHALLDETYFTNWHQDGKHMPIWATRNPTSIFV